MRTRMHWSVKLLSIYKLSRDFPLNFEWTSSIAFYLQLVLTFEDVYVALGLLL